MLNTGTFSEILEATLNESTLHYSETSFNSGWESTLDPLGITQILAELQLDKPSTTGLQTKLNRAYGLKPAKAKVRIRPAHALNADQAKAFQDLKAWALQLNENFDCQELKSAYRSAVLKTHPDRGGSSESFQEVKKSYQILEALVKN